MSTLLLILPPKVTVVKYPVVCIVMYLPAQKGKTSFFYVAKELAIRQRLLTRDPMAPGGRGGGRTVGGL